ncbi:MULTISPECIES: hypothetical protein [unclassified Mycobacterium]|uniref:hypothetical protein n=1 Tax=unclassified Mycobacterium TaxID=2642494 RepID=UPI0009ED3F05|nr:MULTISPECIES: hypothetical protein [unclassified Mycobacterium]
MKRGIAGAATTLLASGCLGLASLVLGAGTAQADSPGPYRWCPGDSMVYHATVGPHTGPGVAYQWDMNVCHTWYWVANGKGNVPYKGHLPSGVWDGDNPPPLQPDWCDFCS